MKPVPRKFRYSRDEPIAIISPSGEVKVVGGNRVTRESAKR